MKTPRDYQVVLLRYRGRSECTDGKGRHFMGDWTEFLVKALFLTEPFESEGGWIPGCGGYFGITHVYRSENEYLDWVGFDYLSEDEAERQRRHLLDCQAT